MTLHKDLALGNNHIIYNWSYADNAALLAATGFVPDDVGKIAYQQDDNSLWMLVDDSPITWDQLTGPGVGGAVASVNGQTGAVVLDADDIADTATNVFASPAELTKLGGIEALADVTDAANVDAAGAVMNSDTSTAAMSFVVDEDAMTSNSATKVPTQQSVKAYVDAAVGGGGLTQEQIEDFIGTTLLVAGTGVTVTYNDGAGTITIAATAGLTQEQIEDFLGTTTIVAGTGITITYSDVANTITVAVTASTYQPLDADLTNIAGLVDPNADRVLFWDDSAGAYAYLTMGTGLTITGTTLDASGSYTSENAMDDVAAALAAGTHTRLTVTYNDAGNSISLAQAAEQSALTWVMDEGGVPALNLKAWLIVPFACTIKRWYILADTTGSIQMDVWKDSYSNYPPALADTITAAAKPALVSGTKATDSTLTGWTTSLAANDVIGVTVESADTLSVVTFAIVVERT